MLQFDWDAVGKQPSARRFLGSRRGSSKQGRTIAALVRERELYGREPQLSSLRCRIAVDTLIHPTFKNLQNDIEPYMKHALLMGLSTDSSYVLCMVVSVVCTMDRYLVIVYLSPTALIPRYTIPVKRQREIDYFQASFSRDSSIISVIASPKISPVPKLVPYFFDASVYIVNLKHQILIDLNATIRMSCRWDGHKLDRIFLRSTDYGAVLNNGLSIIALIFLPSLLRTLNPLKTKVFRLKKAFSGGYEKSDENLRSLVVINGARGLSSSLYSKNNDDEYSLERLGVMNRELDYADGDGIYFAISITEILPFIKIGINKLKQYLSFKVSEIMCADYELDIIECTPDFWIYSIVTTLLEIKTGKGQSLTYVAVFSVSVNVLTRNNDVSVWKKLRAVNNSGVNSANSSSKRVQWYPFSEKINKSVEERIVSDECLYVGKSASILSSPYPGIELEKSASL